MLSFLKRKAKQEKPFSKFTKNEMTTILNRVVGYIPFLLKDSPNFKLENRHYMRVLAWLVENNILIDKTTLMIRSEDRQAMIRAAFAQDQTNSVTT